MNKRAAVIACFAGFLFSLLICVGYAADVAGELLVTEIIWWLAMVLIGMFTSGIVYVLLICSDRLEAAQKTENNVTALGHGKLQAGQDDKRTSNKVRRIVSAWIILICCYIPVFLAVYPGFFVYDATDEFVQVASRTFTTHHPLMHVLLLGGTICAGNKFLGSYNAGIAVYTFIQMVVVSGIFAWVIVENASKAMKPKKAYAIQLVWYGLFPTIVMFVLCSAKDTLFSVFMLAAVVLIIKIADENCRDEAVNADRNNSKKRLSVNIALLGISLIFMMLMRHNGIYAVMVFAVCACIYVYKTMAGDAGNRIRLLKTAGFFILIILLYKGADRTLVALTHAETYENQEILTVPIQQLARSWRPYLAQMEPDERRDVLTYIPETAIARYTPNLSDPVKVDFDNKAFSENPGGFIRIWLKMFAKHPLSFINAWIDTSYGYYYPWTVVNVYQGHTVYTFTYDKSSYFGYETEFPGERISLIPVIDRIYRWLSLDDDIQKMPVVHLLFSMGALFWVYVAVAILFIYKRSYKYLISMALPGGVWLTLLLGPTFLPRYTVFLWFLLPVYLIPACNIFNKRGITQ